MGKLKGPPQVKLIIGLIYRKTDIKDSAIKRLTRHFGSIDFISRPIDFNYTDYYYKELGRPLERLFVSFEKLRDEDALSGIKLYTNSIEKRFSHADKRQINIDPGFLSLGKLVLATTKDNVHRIYLKKGIFAEVTLYYKNGAYNPWPWTYPDYRSKEYLFVFNAIRAIFYRQQKI